MRYYGEVSHTHSALNRVDGTDIAAMTVASTMCAGAMGRSMLEFVMWLD